MNWDVITTDAVVIHEVRLVTSQAFSESVGQALDTTTYYGMQMVSYPLDCEKRSSRITAGRELVSRI